MRTRLFDLRAITPLALAAAGCLLPGAAQGEIFKLASGGQVQGLLVNPDESPRKQYVIQTDAGIRLTLDKAQVSEVVHQLPAEIEYEKIKSSYPDTVEGQRELAEWCREHHLTAKREAHLKRVLELSPDDEFARRILGYSKYEGRWMTHDEVMQKRGWIRYQGKWMLPQKKQILEERKAEDLARKTWMQKLRRIRDALEGPKYEAAIAELRLIDDRYALPALQTLIKDEPLDDVRKLYMDVMAHIGTPAAQATLVQRSLEDPVEELRLTALDHLSAEKQPEIIKLYIAALRHQDNMIVNRAAEGLSAMGDPAAVPALIEALVTSHKFIVGDGSQQGQIASTFGNGPGGGGIGVSGGPKVMTKHLQNTSVLDALIGLTGANFNYDEKAWKSWAAANRPTPNVNTRRDGQ